ncbi:Lipoyl synthase [Fundidesulfovibrio magnetotacticus]|uniref:Lipoyl synthase n=1 Tax=Fundidesulfovibrio magnetotacticus TaxID=2730080 RepID=A0A6V8LYB5_9BACT|nr:lipoyl synthase [Fundidesulfovibrio magnetotacticus]GFK95029.1 Lipoyl synthase [Fundidesulfovibrio magnetotacticus]
MLSPTPSPGQSSPGGKPSPRLPAWLRVKQPRDGVFPGTALAVAEHGLRTVCRQARCPNMFECFGRGVATFLILGGACTRSCGFCNVAHGVPEPPEPDEPLRVAQAAARLGLKHVVITSVTRDDLPDGGAIQFAACVRAVREALPGATVEVLVPDFQGSREALQMVLDAGPDVVNHNLETVPELYSLVRPQARYEQSLELLERVAKSGRASAKSGLMLGLGESPGQVERTLADLATAGCRMVTVGQYLRPGRRNLPVVRYVPPEEFEDVARMGRAQGIPVMYCGPLVRSSHNAGDFTDGMRSQGSPCCP